MKLRVRKEVLILSIAYSVERSHLNELAQVVHCLWHCLRTKRNFELVLSIELISQTWTQNGGEILSTVLWTLNHTVFWECCSRASNWLAVSRSREGKRRGWGGFSSILLYQHPILQSVLECQMLKFPGNETQIFRVRTSPTRWPSGDFLGLTRS